jgi:hypothetical protein
VLYVAWTQSRFSQAAFGDLAFARDRAALFATRPDNIVLRQGELVDAKIAARCAAGALGALGFRGFWNCKTGTLTTHSRLNTRNSWLTAPFNCAMSREFPAMSCE